jgi:predicted transcriptional regulator
MILNFNLNLSKLELDILATLLNHNVTIVDTEARDIIRKALNKGKYNINNYISRLRKKKIFITKPVDKNLYINPSLIEIVRDKKVSFEFIIHE